MKNRTILGVICIVLAVALVFGITPLVSRLGAEKIEVVCAAADIPQGRIITDSDLKLVTVGGYGLPDQIIRTKAEVVGKYAACDLMADGLLMDTQVSATGGGTEDVLRSLDGTKQAMSITIGSFAGGLSGKLRNGDIVSVLVSNGDLTTIPSELRYVRVITATSSNGLDAGRQARTARKSFPAR